jgi:hypothetical protein
LKLLNQESDALSIILHTAEQQQIKMQVMREEMEVLRTAAEKDGLEKQGLVEKVEMLQAAKDEEAERLQDELTSVRSERDGVEDVLLQRETECALERQQLRQEIWELKETVRDMLAEKRQRIGLAAQVIADARRRVALIVPSIGAVSNSNSSKHGALITKIMKGRSADKAGLRRGDIVEKANGVPVTTNEAFRRVVASVRVGDTLVMTILRKAKRLHISMPLECVSYNATVRAVLPHVECCYNILLTSQSFFVALHVQDDLTEAEVGELRRLASGLIFDSDIVDYKLSRPHNDEELGQFREMLRLLSMRDEEAKRERALKVLFWVCCRSCCVVFNTPAVDA